MVLAKTQIRSRIERITRARKKIAQLNEFIARFSPARGRRK